MKSLRGLRGFSFCLWVVGPDFGGFEGGDGRVVAAPDDDVAKQVALADDVSGYRMVTFSKKSRQNVTVRGPEALLTPATRFHPAPRGNRLASRPLQADGDDGSIRWLGEGSSASSSRLRLRL